MKKQNSLEDYNTVHNLALSFKNGNKEDGILLIERFRNYINHYIDLLKFGEFDYSNKSSRKFISIFYYNISKSRTNNIYDEKSKYYWTDKAKKISKLFRDIDKEEVRSLLQYSLLKMSKTYVSERPTFHTYVSRCLHFFVYNEVKRYIKDPLANFVDIECNENEESCLYAEKIISNRKYLTEHIYDNEEVITKIDLHNTIKNSNISKVSNNLEKKDDSFLDINWINGITCSEAFSELTPFERKIILDHDYFNKTDTDIANEYGCVRATINRKRLKAISKIKR